MDKYWEITTSLPNSSNTEVVNDFLLSLKLANSSQGTILQYRCFLELFFKKIKDSFSSLSSEMIHHLPFTYFAFKKSI